jgi:hypothetical protein
MSEDRKVPIKNRSLTLEAMRVDGMALIVSALQNIPQDKRLPGYLLALNTAELAMMTHQVEYRQNTLIEAVKCGINLARMKRLEIGIEKGEAYFFVKELDLADLADLADQ